jgi:lipopolysaccharide export system permease protein
MMNLLDRLVLREILVPLGVGLLAIVQLLVILQLLQLNEVVFGSAVSLRDLGRVTLALAPHFLVVAVPLAFMLGVQLGMGRLAGDQELLALSAAGSHPLRLYRVPLAIGLVLAVCVAALARWAEPWGLSELSRVLHDVIKRNLQSGLTPGVFHDNLPRFTIYVGGQETGGAYGTWNGVLIEDDVGDGAPLLALAEAGRIEDAGGEALSLRLFRGELHRSEPRGETVARFSEGSFLVGVQDSVAKQNRFANNEAQLPAAALRDRIAWLEGQNRMIESARLRVELARRWAVPLACVFFALLGIPLAVAARGVRGSAYLITLGAFVAFYAISRVGLAFAEGGLNPWVAGFLPDAVVAAMGLGYTAQLAKGGVGKPR